MDEIKQNSIVDLKVPSSVAFAKVFGGKQVIEVFPFDFQPICVTYDDHGYEHISNKGRKRRIVRFCPIETGEYKVQFFDKQGNIVEEKSYISNSSTFQKPLKIKNGKGYDENGKYFLPIGINLAFPERFQDSSGAEFGTRESFSTLGLRKYESWIKKVAQNGVNLVRIWCGSFYLTPEKEELGTFDYTKFTLLDKIFEIANKYNVRLKLTIDTFRHFVDDSTNGIQKNIFHKYATYKGKIVNDKEWLNEEKYRQLWLKKLEEYKLRYACNPAFYALEFWNEMNCYGDMNIQELSNWNAYMAERAREMFPNAILLNSIGSLDCDFSLKMYNGFCFEKFDWLQIHSYLDQGATYPEVQVNSIEGLKKCLTVLKDKQNQTGKPFFVAETGAVNDCHSGPFRYYSFDNECLIFVDCVYAPFFLGCLSTGNIWHWDSRYVSSKNLYSLFKPIQKLMENVEFDKENFVPIDLSNDKFYCLLLKGNTQYLAFIRNKFFDWKNILRDEKAPKSQNTEITFESIGAKDLQCIRIWKKEKGRVKLENGNICISALSRGVLLKGSL